MQVYDQVALLFQSHSDLLEEFTQFLPEAGVAHQQSMMQPQAQLMAQSLGHMGMIMQGDGFGQPKQKYDSFPARVPSSFCQISATFFSRTGKIKTSKRLQEEPKYPTPSASAPPAKVSLFLCVLIFSFLVSHPSPSPL